MVFRLLCSHILLPRKPRNCAGSRQAGNFERESYHIPVDSNLIWSMWPVAAWGSNPHYENIRAHFSVPLRCPYF
jgi:hypothetical protein